MSNFCNASIEILSFIYRYKQIISLVIVVLKDTNISSRLASIWQERCEVMTAAKPHNLTFCRLAIAFTNFRSFSPYRLSDRHHFYPSDCNTGA
ncbi:hypothetical protein [Nostoc sp.]